MSKMCYLHLKITEIVKVFKATWKRLMVFDETKRNETKRNNWQLTKRNETKQLVIDETKRNNWYSTKRNETSIVTCENENHRCPKLTLRVCYVN